MLDIVHKRYEDMQWGEKGFFTCTGKKDEENKEKEKKRFLQQDKKITVIVKKKEKLVKQYRKDKQPILTRLGTKFPSKHHKDSFEIFEKYQNS